MIQSFNSKTDKGNAGREIPSGIALVSFVRIYQRKEIKSSVCFVIIDDFPCHAIALCH
ncbi:hypothetical protein HMPREF1990_02095 [Porphyromonas gingivalis W4087]|uniref:Uncharacterized protein n=1 Tax=Porphyromonas gingivalis (strain ATCC 33277 / DSM 20709 / CIP 103683 / JCM 12257 / NCTC 11834 / 2561) TaxID=431947 RepID=B2RI84_PORG3|nr:hypothetical protein HMPREF1553_02092 [Porphyromonas gingivalis F0568]ERJ71342.1 hypothetical protein HMPREF1554_00216 [Porphyromonas gingivalis F0569]ERJ83632.1 hypothetical protein HMPREF1988_01076 [Porphyromonas gingivalis F0185]ERJ85858.1 hypothetical protein HMPREF1990_02095 [Porphyromonas gingivalis W4087]BAG33079.1 hypothetical protein PGN_0560 [Porphyromonas gingivalis ATCC 33277]